MSSCLRKPLPPVRVSFCVACINNKQRDHRSGQTVKYRLTIARQPEARIVIELNNKPERNFGAFTMPRSRRRP